MNNKPIFVEVGSIEMIPVFMSLLEGISIEEDISIFDLVMLTDEFKHVFIIDGKPEHLLKAKKHFSPSTIETLIGIYDSLEMYEYSRVLIDK